MGSTEVAEGVNVSGRILDGSQRDEKGNVNGSGFSIWPLYRLNWTRFGGVFYIPLPFCYISIYLYTLDLPTSKNIYTRRNV